MLLLLMGEAAVYLLLPAWKNARMDPFPAPARAFERTARNLRALYCVAIQRDSVCGSGGDPPAHLVAHSHRPPGNLGRNPAALRRISRTCDSFARIGEIDP